jgi:hypothetical protein
MRQVDEYLAAHGIPHWRINTGALKTPDGRLVRFGAPGMCDWYALMPGGASLWIECKRGRGGRLSGAQKAFIDTINAGGNGKTHAIVVNSVDTLVGEIYRLGLVE